MTSRWGKRRRRILSGAGIGASLIFVVALLVLSPLASAAQVGVVDKKPYSGVAYTATQTSFNGIGCPGTGNYTFAPPFFSLTKGRGGGDDESTSIPCSSGVDEYHEVDMWFGINLSSFRVSTTVKHDHVRFHWSLSYDLLVNTTWAGGSDTSYAFAEVIIGAWVYDISTGVNTGSGSVYDDYTYLDDAQGTQQNYVTRTAVLATMEVTVNLVAGDVYELRSWIESTARAETDGPLGSANNALAQVTWPAGGPEGKLVSITF